MNSTTSSILTEGYTDLGKLEKIRATVGLVICIVIGLILIYCAFNMGNTPQKPTVSAYIISADCRDNNNYNNNNRNQDQVFCNLELLYKVKNIEYKNNISTSSNVYYRPGGSIRIEYDPENPDIINVSNNISNSTLSKISLFVAIIIVGGSIYNYYLVHSSHVYAAAQGASTVAGVFLAPLRPFQRF